MPEYLSPGIYIEEIEIGAKPIEGVNTSTAGFIGLTERGTEKPTLVTGFNDFQRKLGTYIQESYLAYAVEGFFKNGGQKCFVSRIIKGTSTSNRSSLTLNNVMIEAIGRGAWGNNIAIRIDDASLTNVDANLFKITVIFWSKNALADASFTPSTGNETVAIQVDKIKSHSGISTEEYDNLSKTRSHLTFTSRR
jgi:uncharacterized protein